MVRNKNKINVKIIYVSKYKWYKSESGNNCKVKVNTKGYTFFFSKTMRKTRQYTLYNNKGIEKTERENPIK